MVGAAARAKRCRPEKVPRTAFSGVIQSGPSVVLTVGIRKVRTGLVAPTASVMTAAKVSVPPADGTAPREPVSTPSSVSALSGGRLFDPTKA